MQVRTKILLLPFKVRNKVAANALSPLVFLLQLKFEVLEKNVLQRMDDNVHKKIGNPWTKRFWENRENLKSLAMQMLLACQEIFYAYLVGPTERFPFLRLYFSDYETEVIGVWKNSRIWENDHISKTKTENKNHQEGKNLYVSQLSARVCARLKFFCSGEWRPSPLNIPKCWPKE